MANETKWSIDPANSEITFKVAHLIITQLRGKFKTFDASIYTTAKDFKTAEIDLWIDASSISTSDANRDKHLKSIDFFDVQNHKQIRFTSSTVGKSDTEGNHELWGELTIKGITQNVKLNVKSRGIVKDPWGNEKVELAITGKINRGDWGLYGNTSFESGGMMVSKDVKISCKVSLSIVNQEELTMKLDPVATNTGIL